MEIQILPAEQRENGPKTSPVGYVRAKIKSMSEDIGKPLESQISTGLALLGSLTSAAVGGIAGMLSIAFNRTGQSSPLK